MLARCLSASLQGLKARPVVVEVDLAPRLQGVQLVGLPDQAIQESRERVRSALRNSGFHGPLVHVVINLAQADLRKGSPSFDLPIALARWWPAVLKKPSPMQASASWCNPAQIEQARQRMQRRNPSGDSNGRLSAAALRQTGAIEAAHSSSGNS